MARLDGAYLAGARVQHQRLVRAVREVGSDRLADSYRTNFWYPLGARPRNLVEEVIERLRPVVRPGRGCVGVEWWLGRLPYGRSLPLHFDRDMTLEKRTGRVVHPQWSSILYLNRFPSSPTVVLDQVLSPDGKSWIPPEASSGRSLDAVPNHYVAFRGDLRHGVVANEAGKKLPSGSRKSDKASELRLTLLVNYWDRRPSPPNCQDYDGTVYRSIQDEGVSPTAVSRRRPAA